MRAALEQQLQQIWYGNRRPGLLLRGLSRVYRIAHRFDQKRKLSRYAKDLEGLPLLVVGNLAVGGAGKTPLVAHLCQMASAAGLKVGIVSRGYGRKSRQPVQVRADTSTAEAGDEPVLLAQRCAVPVQVDENRERAARGLYEQGCTLVIADDGLQRSSLPRTIEVCVVDGVRKFGNELLLPAGPLREPLSRLESVDYVVHHLSAAAAAKTHEPHWMCLHAGALCSLDGQQEMTLKQLTQNMQASKDADDAGHQVHAIAGIARPQRFFDLLAGQAIKVETHVLADHHDFTVEDFDWAEPGSMILMTEKDAVKCRHLGLQNAWYLPVEVALSEPLNAAFRDAFSRLAADHQAKLNEEGMVT